MKRNTWLTTITSCGLAILLSYSGLCCLVTAFPLSAVRLDTLFLWCVVISLCFSLCHTLKLQLIPLCTLALLAWLLWSNESLEQSVEWLLYQISRRYDLAYGCGVLSWSDPPLKDGDITLALCTLATLITLTVSHALSTGQSIWLAMLTSLLPLVACLIVADTIPETKWLYLLLIGLALLILPHSLRRVNSRQGSILTVILIIPVLLSGILLFRAVPEQDYNRQQQAAKLYDAVFGWFSNSAQSGSGNAVFNLSEAETVDLTNAGRKERSQRVVMDVSGTATGTLYLRGQALDTYTGKSWINTSRVEALYWPSQTRLIPAGTLTLTTRNVLPIQYIPYYVEDITLDKISWRVTNRNKQTKFTYALMSLPGDLEFPAISSPAIRESLSSVHIPLCDLPEDTKAWAKALLETFLQPEDRKNPIQTAAAIATWVSSSAEYNLRVDTMPQGQDDFVRWFLEEQDEGYCVHFASAATVLLRAAGIPARYATGYIVTKAAKPVVVRQADAHAWAEYWVNGIGWMVLEATPGGSQSSVPTQSADSTRPSTESATPTASTTATDSLATQPISTTVPSETAKDSFTPTQPVQIGVLKPLLWVVSAVCLLLLQWKLRFSLRQRRLRQSNRNAQAIALWREAVYLSRLLSEPPHSGLFATAQKAKFSPHTITPEELSPLDDYVRQARDQLRRKPIWQRWIYQIILAVC